MRLFRKRFWRHWWQRRTRGWDDSELWNLDLTFARYIQPRLSRFRETTYAYPNGLSMDEWRGMLWKMERAFTLLSTDDWFPLFEEGKQAEVEEGLKLFAEYYQSLWI